MYVCVCLGGCFQETLGRERHQRERSRQEEKLFLLPSCFAVLFSDNEMPRVVKPINLVK